MHHDKPARPRQQARNGIAAPILHSTLDPDHERWLEARGIDCEVIASAGIVTAELPGGGDWVAIPVRRSGSIAGHKYLSLDSREIRTERGTPIAWWNLDVLEDTTLSEAPLIVAQDALDALALMTAGYQRVLAVPNGAPESPSESNARYRYVADSLDRMRDIREIVLATKAGRPGEALMHDLAIRLGRGRCKYVTYPAGLTSLCEVLLGGGPAAISALLQAARWCHVPGLFRMSELPPVPHAEPHNTMIPNLHAHYNLRRGDMTVMTGIPGSGKSTLVNDITCRMAEHHQWSTCFASFEQHPQLDHRRALRTWINRKPEEQQSPGELEAADAWIDQYFSFVIPDEDEDATLEWVLDRLASAVVRYGADIAVIDPWNEMDHAKPKDMTTTEYVGMAIRQLKKFARRYNVHLIVVAHPSKMHRDKDGVIPMPTLYDISDSANWFNKPDVGIIVHPMYDEETRSDYTAVRIAKSRYHDQIGAPGIAKLTFNRHQARFMAWE